MFPDTVTNKTLKNIKKFKNLPAMHIKPHTPSLGIV